MHKSVPSNLPAPPAPLKWAVTAPADGEIFYTAHLSFDEDGAICRRGPTRPGDSCCSGNSGAGSKGRNRRLRPYPRQLDRLTKSVYPNLAQTMDGCKREPWTGFRPMSADGLPYIGTTSCKGLWVNTGHGHLGWTLATGSAELLANLILDELTALDASTYSITRSH